MWLLFCYFYSEHSCSGDMSVANHTDKSLEEFYKLKYCSTVVYMVPRA